MDIVPLFRHATPRRTGAAAWLPALFALFLLAAAFGPARGAAFAAPA